MELAGFDDQGRFVLAAFAGARPFSSFLPGMAGPLGIPMWAFYVNRGQAIASFGVENKDNPIMEFQPANKAYQTTPYTGFRTFMKLDAAWSGDHAEEHWVFYEPFAPWSADDETHMVIGMNELELHGAGFVARLTGATAEFLSMWSIMMFGQRPFFLKEGALCLRFQPTLPGWLFDEATTVRTTFLGHTGVVYHNPERWDVYPGRASVARMHLRLRDGTSIDIGSGIVGPAYAGKVRLGRARQIDVFLERDAGMEEDARR
jgi:hypothetical protein